MKFFTLAILVTSCSIASAQNTVASKDAGKHVGEKISICGKVSGSKSAEVSPSRSTIIQVSTQSGTSPVNVVIKQDDRKNFGYKPEEFLYSKNVCVTGIVTESNGKAEVVVRRPEEIKVEETGAGAEIRLLEFDPLNRFFQDED